MSNQIARPPLSGVIRQHGRIAGSIQLPLNTISFIEQFNRQYAALGLKAEPTETPEPDSRPESRPDA